MNGFSAEALDDYKAEKDSFFYYKRVFVYSLVIAVAITLPFVIVELIKTGKPIFLYYGDYNAQQICFYEHCVDMVRSGSINWDWYTDLGSNFVGSYSYYMLGSPFFWLMCLFPAEWAPYLMAPAYVLKYITAALIAYSYIKRFVKRQNYAVLGALLYAFCGFQIYNTFFNQFHEVVAFFPLLLLGMEELVQNNRRGLFALAVAVNAMCNYFMFAGQVVFCLLYFIFRFSQKSFRITWKKFGLLFFEAVLGVLMSAVIFLPGILAVWNNPRVDRHFSGWKMFVYLKNDSFYWQRYGHILSTFFFPPDIPSRVNFFYGHKERWASIAAYVPLFGMSGVFAFLASKKRSWLKAFIVLLIISLFVPVMNSMFFLFNSTYYARWMYMLVLMMVMATVIMLDDEKSTKKWRGGIIAHLICAAAIFIPLGFMWYDDPETKAVNYKLGRPPYIERFWIYTAIMLISIAILWYIFKKIKRGTPTFEKACLISASAIIVVYSCVHITNGKQHSWSSDFMVNRAIEGEVNLDDDEFSRIDFYRDDNTSTLDNLGIYWGYPSIECFHTVVPPSIMEFYPKIGVSRNVGSRSESRLYGLRAFASVKYSFIDSGKTHEASGFTLFDKQNGYEIYKNDNYLPMGFVYQEFMTETEFEKVPKSSRHALLCTYLVVPDELAEYYSGFMSEIKYGDDNFRFANYDTFTESVAERRQMTGESFACNSNGFVSKIKLDSPNVVFFSVPYDDGWSVTVNGEEEEVLKADYGFMAAECAEGENEIIFSYRAPGLNIGIMSTVIALLIWCIYLLISRKKGSYPTYRFFKESYYEEDKIPVSKLQTDAIELDGFNILSEEDISTPENKESTQELKDDTPSADSEPDSTDDE